MVPSNQCHLHTSMSHNVEGVWGQLCEMPWANAALILPGLMGLGSLAHSTLHQHRRARNTGLISEEGGREGGREEDGVP